MKNLKIEKFKFKNLAYIIFVAFTFSLSFNFVFADDTCECKLDGSSVISKCNINGHIVSTSTCAIGNSGSFPKAVGECACKLRITSGGLVPCIDDCSAEDLFGNAASYETNPPIWTSLLRTALGISGIFILAMFVYGGIRIIVSRGDKAAIKKATDIMKNSIYGLLIVLFAYTFVKFVVIALVAERWTLFFGGQ